MDEIWTVGYGGVQPTAFVPFLQKEGVRALIDVRLRPDRASMGSYVRARDPGRGIQALLAPAGIEYVHLTELGNLFVDDASRWQSRYAALLDRAGEVVLERTLELLPSLPRPFALMCSEKDPAQCHRTPLAGWLARRHGWTVRHLVAS